MQFYASLDPAGLVWHGKRPEAGNGKKMEIEMENGPELDRGRFPLRFPFFFFFFDFRLLAVFHAIPARQDPNPMGVIPQLSWHARRGLRIG